MWAPTYFAPTYFAPAYWPTSPVAAPVARPLPSDRAVYDAIRDILLGLAEFDAVTQGRTWDAARATADRGRVAHIEPGRPRVDPDGSPSREFRQVSYTLHLAVGNVEDPDAAYDTLDRLEDAVRNALLAPAAKRYAGFCIPRFSQLGAGTIDQSDPRTWVNRMTGSFAYSVSLAPSLGGYAASA